MRTVDTEGFQVIRHIVEDIGSINRVLYYDVITIQDTINETNCPITDCIIFRCDESYGKKEVSSLRAIVRQERLSQFDSTHEQMLDMYSKNYDVTGYGIVKCKYNSELDILKLDLTALRETLRAWDNMAERFEAPTNEGVSLKVIGNMESHLRKGNLAEKIVSLSSTGCYPSYMRTTLYPSQTEDTYVDFVIERIMLDGTWSRILNGGLVYHVNTDTWSSHT
jgi:hypothetical protein